LRLAKRNKHTPPTLKKHQAVLDTFLPLLTPENGEKLVLHAELVKIAPGVLERLQLEQVSAKTRRDSVLDLDETHGTILEDLSADPSMLFFEFKVYLFTSRLIYSRNGYHNPQRRRQRQIHVGRVHCVAYVVSPQRRTCDFVLWIYRLDENLVCVARYLPFFMIDHYIPL